MRTRGHFADVTERRVSTGGANAIEMVCPSSLLVGQKSSCSAVAHLSSGQNPVVYVDATIESV
jgi:hypothetical protein